MNLLKRLGGRVVGSGDFRKGLTFFKKVTDFTFCGRNLLGSFVGLANRKIFTRMAELLLNNKEQDDCTRNHE
jgi:hypothetical protein